MSRRVAGLLALASGAVTALTLPVPGLCPLGWVALAPLLLAAASSDGRRAAWLGFLAGFAFHGVAFYWVYSTCRFAGVPVPVGLLAWGALAAFQALAWALWAWLGRRAAEALPRSLRAAGWAVLWTAIAFACERWTPRLPGDLLEYTQWRHLSLIQIASLTGPHGLGFLVMLVNASLAQVWRESDGGRGEAPFARPGFALAIAFVIAAWAYGAYCLAARQTNGSSETARVEVLQPNIDQYHKWDETFAGSINDNFRDLLNSPRRFAPRLIVWPESSIPRWVGLNESPTEAKPGFGTEQVIGVVSTDGAEGNFNSVFHLGVDGKVRGRYHKRELVPFGEYIPFPWLKPFIGILNQLGGITGGAAAQELFATPLGPAAATLCYEAVFPRWFRSDTARGARLILNLTNDGWYKHTWGPYQHFNTNVFRAVENRVTVIRSGNTGISGVIDPWGVVLASLPLGTRGRLDAEVPLDREYPRGSFYTRRGDWFGWLMFGLAVVLLGATYRRGQA